MKSAQQMVLTAQDMKEAGISIPILVGGAALSRKFTDTKIAKEYDGLVLYAKDAMNGLSLANQASISRGSMKNYWQKKSEKLAALATAERVSKSFSCIYSCKTEDQLFQQKYLFLHQWIRRSIFLKSTPFPILNHISICKC